MISHPFRPLRINYTTIDLWCTHGMHTPPNMLYYPINLAPDLIIETHGRPVEHRPPTRIYMERVFHLYVPYIPLGEGKMQAWRHVRLWAKFSKERPMEPPLHVVDGVPANRC